MKIKLIILVASVLYALLQSAASADNGNNFRSQDLSQLHLYYRDAGHPQISGVRLQPGETHSRNLQSVYSCYEQINFAYMSGKDFRSMFQDVTDQKVILQNYELYAFDGFKDYVCGLSDYKEFILFLKDKIENDKKIRKQTVNIPGFEYSFFLWKEKSGFHAFINEEVCRIIAQENFSRGTDVRELIKELKSNNTEHKPVPWAIGYEDRYKKRLHALEQIISDKEVWTTKQYSVSRSLDVLQKDFEPKLSSLQEKFLMLL